MSSYNPSKLLADPPRPLRLFLEDLGLSEEILKPVEGVEDLELETWIDPDRLTGLTVDRVRSLCTDLGGSLDGLLRADINDSTKELKLNAGITAQEIARFQRQVRDTSSITLEIIVNKKLLVDYWLVPHAHCKFFIFFFADTFLSLLQSEPKRLYKALWGNETDRKAIVLIPKYSMLLDGPLLAVLGGEHAQSWNDVIPDKDPDKARLDRVYASARKTEHLRWLDFDPGRLTPYHLKLEGEPAKNPIFDGLIIHAINLAIMYTANRVEYKDAKTKHNSAQEEAGNPPRSLKGKYFEATYTSRDQAVKLRLAKPDMVISDSAFISAQCLMDAVEWAYSRVERRDLAEDRLPMVQITMAQALHLAPEEDRYDLLIGRACSIYEDMEIQWRAFIQGKLDVYIDKLRELEDYIDEVVGNFHYTVTTMVDQLSKTMLAAIATAIGSFIGAIFSDPFNPVIFRIGMLTYAIYALIFPLGYNMFNNWDRYKLLEAEYDRRNQNFVNLLFKERVIKIVGQRVLNSKTRFLRWYWLTVLSYGIVILLAILAAYWIPEIIIEGS